MARRVSCWRRHLAGDERVAIDDVLGGVGGPVVAVLLAEHLLDLGQVVLDERPAAAAADEVDRAVGPGLVHAVEVGVDRERAVDQPSRPACAGRGRSAAGGSAGSCGRGPTAPRPRRTSGAPAPAAASSARCSAAARSGTSAACMQTNFQGALDAVKILFEPGEEGGVVDRAVAVAVHDREVGRPLVEGVERQRRVAGAGGGAEGGGFVLVAADRACSTSPRRGRWPGRGRSSRCPGSRGRR